MEAYAVNLPMQQRLDIDTDYLAAQLKALLDIPSPTGYTDSVARYVCGELERIGIEYDLTRRGAVRGVLPGDGSEPERYLLFSASGCPKNAGTRQRRYPVVYVFRHRTPGTQEPGRLRYE